MNYITHNEGENERVQVHLAVTLSNSEVPEQDLNGLGSRIHRASKLTQLNYKSLFNLIVRQNC